MQPNLVYVGTYTRDGRSEGIHRFRHDPETGQLKHLGVTPERDPSFLALDPSKRFLFSVVEDERMGEAASFAINQETGELTFLSRQSTLGGEPCHLATDPSGRFLAVANHEQGSVALLPIDGDGQLRPASDRRQHEGSGPGPTQQGPHAHFVTLDPPQQRFLVADKGIDKVMIYRLDAEAGQLVPADPPFGTLHSGAAPRHIAFHPSGRFVYVNGEADMTVTAFTYDGETGVMEELHHLSTLPEGTDTTNCSTAEIVVHSSGRHLYVSNRGDNTIAIFAIDQETGRLTAAGHVSTQGSNPRNIALDPSGTYLYAANQDSNTLVHFRVDAESGQLTPTGDITEVGAPVCILFA